MQPVFASAACIGRQEEYAIPGRPGGRCAIETANPETGKLKHRSGPMEADSPLSALGSCLEAQTRYILMERVMKGADGYLAILAGNRMARPRPYPKEGEAP